MAIIFITSGSAGSANGSSVTASGINTTGASFLVANIVWFKPAGSFSFTDSYGNTWTPLTTRFAQDYASTRLYYCFPPANKVGSGHTFSVTTDSPGIAVAAFSGVNPAGTIQESGAVSGGLGSGTQTAQAGSLTPGTNGSLIIHGSNIVGTSPSINSSLTLVSSAFESGKAFGCNLGYLIQTTAAAINPTLTWNNSSGGERCIALATFTPLTQSDSLSNLYSAWPELNS